MRGRRRLNKKLQEAPPNHLFLVSKQECCQQSKTHSHINWRKQNVKNCGYQNLIGTQNSNQKRGAEMDRPKIPDSRELQNIGHW